MNFLQRRRWKKTVKRAIHESRHIRLMRMDVVEPSLIAAVEQGESMLSDALATNDVAQLQRALDELGHRVERIAPVKWRSSVRENLEILVVALGVAMAFRTYFIQPFKIPTGSMQPTLYGIKVASEYEKTWADTFPVSLGKRLITGTRYVEVRAPATGSVQYLGDAEDAWSVLKIQGRSPLLPFRRILSWLIGKDPPGPVSVFSIGQGLASSVDSGTRLFFVHRDLKLRFHDADIVTNGQLLATGLVSSGDHIFVNRLAYNFGKPDRGDVFVFSTKDITYPNVRPDNYYIKRLVGLPGETIEIREPYLFADGVKVTEPPSFIRQYEARSEGYRGYIYPDVRQAGAAALGPGKALSMGGEDYLPMGDNTYSSLDGRFFGPVRRNRILGPAFMVYWPFGPRWGLID